MKDDFVEVPVTLTRQEAAEVEVKARSQGVSTPDFLSYCVRCIAFGINTAVSMLPKQGHVGTHDEQE